MISTIDVLLKGDTTGLETALDKGERKLDGFKSKASKPTPPVAVPGASQVSSAASGALNAFAGGLPGGSLVIATLGQIQTGAAGATGGIGMLAGGLIGLGAAAITAAVALAKMGLSQMTVIGQQARMADMLGLSLGSLQALEYGAARAGISAEDLAHNLTKLEKGATEVGGKVGKALNELKIDPASFGNMKTLDQWQALSGEMGKIKNNSDGLRLSVELFGKSGAGMWRIFKDGKGDIQAMRQEAEKLGLVTSQADAAKIQEANRAWKEMSMAVTGISNDLAIMLSPAVKTVANFVKGMLVGMRDLFGEANTETAQWALQLKAIPDYIAVGFVSLATTTMAFFTETLPECLKASFSFIVDGFMHVVKNLGTLWDKFKGWVTGDKVTIEWDTSSSDKIADAFKKAKDSFKRPFSDLEKQMMDDLEAKLNPKNKPKKNDPDAEPDKGKGTNVGQNNNPTALAGSLEAFAIISGDQKDKMFNVSNQQLSENKKQTAALIRILTKMGGKNGLKKAEL